MLLSQNLSFFLSVVQAEEGLNLSELAQKLGVARSSLQKMLLCQGNPRLDTVERMARKLNVDPSLLLVCSRNEQQLEALSLLLEFLRMATGLSPDRRRKLAELLPELTQLWSGPQPQPEEDQ